MKILKTVFFAFCMLVSIFFVVYANIQANFAQEQKSIAEQLAEEAIELQEMAEEAATEAFEEREKMRKELEECRSSK